jgi:hypothetical protein
MGKRKAPEVPPWTPPTWLQSGFLDGSAKGGDGSDGDANADTTPRMIIGMGTYSDAELSVRRIMGQSATKRYDCPLCNQHIERGTPHVVVVPNDAPELRRHFHTPCWKRRK